MSAEHPDSAFSISADDVGLRLIAPTYTQSLTWSAVESVGLTIDTKPGRLYWHVQGNDGSAIVVTNWAQGATMLDEAFAKRLPGYDTQALQRARTAKPSDYLMLWQSSAPLLMHPLMDPEIHHDLLKTQHGRVGYEFARALANERYAQAYDMLAENVRSKLPIATLQSLFIRMTQNGVVRSIEALDDYGDYPDKPVGEIGGVYVHIGGHGRLDPVLTFNEAVTVFVCIESGEPRVREVIWGRP